MHWPLGCLLWLTVSAGLGCLSYGLIEDSRVLRDVVIGESLAACLCVAAFVSFLELFEARVRHPERLAIQTGLPVHSLPPIPTERLRQGLGPAGFDQRIANFTERLDYLCAALCGNNPEQEEGRCVLITSAVVGEGTSVLAAQLAGRCGAGGMSTLLIDADSREASLGRFLDIPDGPGFSDLLQDLEPDVYHLITPYQGGLFYLLQAGAPSRKFSACSGVPGSARSSPSCAGSTI